MGRKRKDRGTKVHHDFFCRSCFFARKKQNASFKGAHYSIEGIYVCPGLTRHLLANRDCDLHYIESVERLNNGNLDYKSSLLQYREPLFQPKRPRIHSPSEIGIAGNHGSPSNTASSSVKKSDVSGHRLLNQQVIFNSLRPRLDVSVIAAALSLYQSDHSALHETQESPEAIKEAELSSQCEEENNDERQDPLPFENNNDSHLGCISVATGKQHARTSSNGNQGTETEQLKEKEIHTMCDTVPPHPIPVFTRITPHLIAEVELLNILQRNNLPMNTFKFVMDWAIRCNNSDLPGLIPTASRKRPTVLTEICDYLPRVDYTFKPYGINMLPDNKLVQVHVRSFRQALFLLLTNHMLVKEENFSFPLSDTPFLPKEFELQNDVPITELHHGRWWTESWKSLCTESDQILVPIIFYMDGISIDSKANLTLTPLNMTLGIFNTETRKKSHAWETIYFHPDKIQNSKKSDGFFSVSNLHSGLRVALQSFKDVCEQDECIKWDELPYASRKWSVRMKFAIAYVIGDTQLHDQLCCRYGSFNQGVKVMCRHCKCPSFHIANPRNAAHRNQLFTPTDFMMNSVHEVNDKKLFKSISHHRIDNVFHHHEFGVNKQNIHMATPGECLHMHQLGVAKRTIESLKNLIPREDEFNLIALRVGGLIGRQSDRLFPRTKFGSSVLNKSMKEGQHYAGMLLCILVALLSSEGRKLTCFTENELKGQVYFIELVLGMEEFLKHGTTTLSGIVSLRKMMRHFLSTINKQCRRDKGMENKLIKNHLYLHVPEYIERWGPPSGWDSASSESHHKTEIKGPAKNTQRNASTLVEQTWNRKRDKYVLNSVSTLYQKFIHDPNAGTGIIYTTDVNRVRGSMARVFLNKTKDKPCMVWDEVVNRKKSKFPDQVLQFCCENILPIIDSEDLKLHTEHQRVDDNGKYMFRAHPSYRSKGGQDSNVWYDWANFCVDKSVLPCQILGFVYIHNIKPGTHIVNEYPIKENGIYAIVRRFIDPPKPVLHSKFIEMGTVSEELYLLDCDMIDSIAAVVHDRRESSAHDNQFFVLKNRSQWLNIFTQRMDALG